MASSMTAFARAESGNVTWELRSVNHRFLELSFRLPEGLRDLEQTFRQAAKKHLNRGKVDATLRIGAITGTDDFTIDQPKLLHLLATLEQLRRDAPQIAEPSSLELLRWPGVLTEQQDDLDTLKVSAHDAFVEALTGLVGHRSREGEQLDSLLRARLDEIERIVAEVRSITIGQGQAIRDKLKRRLDDVIEGISAKVDHDRLEQEIVLLVQRADVIEELDRLDIHVAESRTCLESPGPHGRRLDFLIQELNREANTLASKSVLPESSQHAVDLKVLIEQMREQVQNVE